MRVITWATPTGHTIDITPAQEEILRASGRWPREASGEYCQVHRGLHHTDAGPTYTDEEIRAFASGGELPVNPWGY